MKREHLSLKILLAGEGGQGIQVMAQILQGAAYQTGLQTVYIPNYGVEQRGGVSLAYLQISTLPIPYPKFKTADILVLMCERAIPRVKPYQDSQTQVINGIFFLNTSAQHNLSPKTHNMLILGILSTLLPINPEVIRQTMKKRFQKASALLLNQNEQAFLLGRGLGLRLPQDAQRLKKIPVDDHRKWSDQISVSKKHPKIIHTIIRRYCKSCGTCISRCPTKALHFSKTLTGIYGTPIVEVDIKKCIGCKMCETVCPDTAISVKKEEPLADSPQKS